MFLLRSRMQNTQTGSCLTLVGGAGRNLPTPGALSGTRCGEAPVPTTCGDVPGAVLPFSVRFPTQEGLSSGLASLLCVRLMSKWTSNQAVTTSTFCSPFTHPWRRTSSWAAAALHSALAAHRSWRFGCGDKSIPPPKVRVDRWVFCYCAGGNLGRVGEGKGCSSAKYLWCLTSGASARPAFLDGRDRRKCQIVLSLKSAAVQSTFLFHEFPLRQTSVELKALSWSCSDWSRSSVENLNV